MVLRYASLLKETRIHRCQNEVWGFFPPKQSEVKNIWKAIAAFCLEAQEQTQTLDQLYTCLESPPYGVKRGAIPVLLAAVLLHYADDVSVYKDGTFIPVLGAEHFELLVKDPTRYAVKYVGVDGLRAQIFHELEIILRSSNVKTQDGRNTTLLSVVKPLFQFCRKLPQYTLKTRRLSAEAQAVLQAILQAQEPDKLLFMALPKALGLSAIMSHESENSKTSKEFCRKLVQAVQEIQAAYERLLQDCRSLLMIFSISEDEAKLREELRVRSRSLIDGCIDPLLRRFTIAAAEESTTDQEWLEALVMIVADKPAESWTDEDLTRFEMKLGDLARKFKNLVALRAEVDARSQEEFEVRRVTLTRPDGMETSQMIWMTRQQQSVVDGVIEEILARTDFGESVQLRQVLATRLLEVEGETNKLDVPSQPTSKPIIKKQQSSRG
jgi:hypothetical protein